MTYKRFIDAVIITIGLVLLVLGLADGEVIAIIIGLFIAVVGAVALIPRDRTQAPKSGD